MLSAVRNRVVAVMYEGVRKLLAVVRLLAVVMGAVAIVGVAGLQSGCSGPPTQSAAPAPVPVVAVPVEAAPDAVAVGFHGVLRARARSQVAPQVAGVLAERPVQLGTRVATGDVLAVLEHPSLDPTRRAALAEAAALEPRLRKAELDLQRERALFARGLIAADRVDAVESDVQSLAASLRRARASASAAAATADELIVRAPHAGIVDRILAEPGDYLAAGQPVLVLSDPDELEAEFLLPPRLAATLEPGAELALRGLADARPWPAVVREKSGGGDGSGLVRVVAALADSSGSRIAGEPVEARFPMPLVAAVRLPVESLRAAGGVPPATVLTVEDGRVARHVVEPRHLLGDAVLADARLPVGALVITAAPAVLPVGTAVRVLP